MWKQRHKKVECLIEEPRGGLLQIWKPNNWNPDTTTFGAVHFYFALHLRSSLQVSDHNALVIQNSSTTTLLRQSPSIIFFVWTTPSLSLSHTLDSRFSCFMKTCRWFFTWHLRHRIPILPLHIKCLSKISSYINKCNPFLLVLTNAISHNQ